jgi:DNA-binding helix-hairpin-helix protein with protein kinase domain
MFNAGARVRLAGSGRECRVDGLLGEGGQGSVFLARDSSPAAPEYALKWYLPWAATVSQRRAIETLVDRGAPGAQFLWPIDVAESDDVGGFGYVMPLRPPGYVGLADLMSGRVDAGFRQLSTLGMGLAHAFLLLHNEGFCYRDISFGNAFFEPASGESVVCDNDNVGVDGVTTSAVRGTPYFMAPEVLRGDADPSADTDRFSLAVLLFYILMVHHPFEGSQVLQFACWDEQALQELFGTHPVFVFDPDDASNRPVAGLHDNVLTFWPIYPEFLRALFVTSFTSGVRDPRNGRVPDGVWRASMARLRDAIMYCQRCGKECFFDEQGAPPLCWNCRRAVRVPPRLRLARHTLMLNHDARVYGHHLLSDYDFTTVVAEVEQNPTQPAQWGLRNVGSERWTVVSPGGSEHEVRPGRAIALRSGLQIDFGARTGEVVASDG